MDKRRFEDLAEYKQGKIGESLIAGWMRSRGNVVLPIYEKEISEGKGPTLFFPSGEEVIGTDLLCMKGDRVIWVEAKHKTAFSWYRIKEVWNTGIDIRHYEDYVKIANYTNYPVWLMFLHKGGQAKDSPPSPSGLFGNNIKRLTDNECHRDYRASKSGMVYWNKDDLIQLATLDEVYKSNGLLKTQQL